MSVPTEVGATRPTPDGATSLFSVPFYFQDDDDLEVTITSSSDVDTVLTKTTHYTVADAGDPDGGSITLLSPYNNLAASYKLTIRLKPALNNQSAFRNAGRIAGSAIEDALDRMSQRIIRLEDDVKRSLKLPVKEAGSSTATVIPDSTDRASKYLTFDASGNPTGTTTVASGVLTISAFGTDLVDDANAGAAQTTLGISTFVKTVLDDADGAAVQTTLGISAAAQTILDDASVAAIRTTLGIDGASGNIAALDLADAATAQIFQARLTGTSGSPVADTSTIATIYLTPYKGNKIAVYTGSRWKLMALTEISLALTATSGLPYDVWVYDNAGTLTLETTAWTNTTTRATAITFQNGVYCKSGTLTRRYVGTFYATASNQTDDSVTKRCLFNYYNRVKRPMRVRESTNSWGYTTLTWRQANGATANKLEYVVGVGEDSAEFTLIASSSNTSGGVDRSASIGFDSTTSGPGSTSVVSVAITGSANEIVQHSAFGSLYGSIGYHYASWNEISEATGTTTWYGDTNAGSVDTQSALYGEVWT